MTEIKPNAVYTTSEAKDVLKISSSTMKRLLKKGLIKAAKIGKQHRILGHELLRLLSPDIDKQATDIYQNVKKKIIKNTSTW